MTALNKPYEFYAQAQYFIRSAKLATDHRAEQTNKNHVEWNNFECVIVGTSHAFAVELLIKGILISRGEDPSKKHDLVQLLDLLPKDDVKSIKDSFEEKQNNGEIESKNSFDELLSSHKEMFVKMRYACEQAPPQLDMSFTCHIAGELSEKLKSLCQNQV